MSNINNGGPAFPVHPEIREQEPHAGMKLRDYLAAKAMQGAIADSCGVHTALDPAIHAVWAYQMADAMVKERERT